MNTPGVCGLISKARKICGNRLAMGAGTVLTLESLKAALDCGATFIVTPVLIREVVEYCVNLKIPVFAGALTPLEIYDAWQAGATMVKVFPAKFFGPEYLREIKGPFNEIELLACSGVTPENMSDYFRYGASAVSFGASVFRKEWLATKDFKSIAQAVKRYIDTWSHQGLS